jgi:hypothetical protein
MPPIDSDLTVRDWLKTATPGTVIQGKVSRFQFVVTERRTLNAIGTASPSNARTALCNSIANYKITPPEGAVPLSRPKAGERVKVTIEGTVTAYSESGSAAFEIKTDSHSFLYFGNSTLPTVEVITPPLPTGTGTVLATRMGTKYILLGDKWLTVHGGSHFNTTLVQEAWDRGDLSVSTL